MRRRALPVAFSLLALPGIGSAHMGPVPPPPMAATPGVLQEIGFDQKLGETIPLDLVFQDEAGKEVRLGDYFGTKPVVLSLVYYDCPMLSTLSLNGIPDPKIYDNKLVDKLISNLKNQPLPDENEKDCAQGYFVKQ